LWCKSNDTNTNWNIAVESEWHPTKYEKYSGPEEDSKYTGTKLNIQQFHG
jgi:hypothetical protein